MKDISSVHKHLYSRLKSIFITNVTCKYTVYNFISNLKARYLKWLDSILAILTALSTAWSCASILSFGTSANTALLQLFPGLVTRVSPPTSTWNTYLPSRHRFAFHLTVHLLIILLFDYTCTVIRSSVLVWDRPHIYLIILMTDLSIFE